MKFINPRRAHVSLSPLWSALFRALAWPALTSFACIYVPTMQAAPVALSDVLVSDSDNPSGVAQTVSLAAGADLIRVIGDWSPASGSPKSNELELTVTGPDGQTGLIRAFTNAMDDSSVVAGLTGDAVLTSQGTAGLYTFTWNTSGSATSANMQNVSVTLETILEQWTDSGALNVGDPTFDRLDESFAATGIICRYETFQFTPAFTGTYTIDSEQLYDGFIYLFSGAQTTAPFSNGIAANDDSAEGISNSRLDVLLNAGQTYTLVTSSFDPGASGSYTNTIRFSAPVALTYAGYDAVNGLVAGPAGDDNDNGLSNIVEFALQRSPTDPVAPAMEVRVDNDRLVCRFFRDRTLLGIDYVVEASRDLSTWVTLFDSGLTDPPNSDGNFHEVTDTEMISPRRFVRLTIDY